MSVQANKEIVRRYQDAYNTNNMDALAQVVAVDIKTPGMLPGFAPGIEGLKQLHAMTLDAWPNAHVTIEDLVAEDDYVVARITMSATPAKPGFGITPNGKSFSISGMYRVRIENGKIVEHLGVEDALGIMQQMGLMPTPGL